MPYTVEATLHHTAADMLKYLAKSHFLTWVSKSETTTEEDELLLGMSIMKDNIDVLVTKFQQQMYTGFSKMLIEMGELYCYHNQECLRCNGILIISKAKSIVNGSPLLAPRLQHMGKHFPLSLLTPYL